MGEERFRVRALKTIGRPTIDLTQHKIETEVFELGPAIAAAVYEVSANERELTGAQVLELLERGQLRSTDLVQLGGVWKTLVEAPPFFEVAERRARVERRVRLGQATLLFMASMAVIGGVWWFLVFHVRPW